MSNTDLWDSVEKTDPKHTKGFSRGGGFKGTATNATYLAKKATERFGPCGTGWGLNVLSEEVMQGAPLIVGDAQVGSELIHKLHVRLWYVLDGKRGEVEHFGQTQFVGKNKNGFYTDEEAPKKSMTDAMSKCLSLLGFSADIHMGLYDDNKYVQSLQKEFSQITQEQADDLKKKLSDTGSDVVKFLEVFQIGVVEELSSEMLEKALKILAKKAAKPEA